MRNAVARGVAGVALGAAVIIGSGHAQSVPPTTLGHPIAFVSRQIPEHGSIYWDEVRGLAGVGPFSRLQTAGPGRLQVLHPDGTIRTLAGDGAPPGGPAIVDVSSADVSYDGERIVFAGLLAGAHDRGPSGNPGAWRIFVIDARGGRVRQVTVDDARRDDLVPPLRAVDDYDPVWLPDGRIVFASTRFPSFAQYGGARTSNLYVVEADGRGLHRITAERNGADRPAVDPVTGQIVFARWWRNHRFPLDRLEATRTSRGYAAKDGLSSVRDVQLDGTAGFADLLWRNAWHLATVRPDGTGLAMWTGSTASPANDERNHAYGGAFDRHGVFYANYFPMYNMTEAAGFGGIRRFVRGPGDYQPVAGVTRLSADLVRTTPPSFGIHRGQYATDALPLPDGRLVVSFARGIDQDYGLYEIDRRGSVVGLVHDAPGTAELRAVAVAPRPRPPVLRDEVSAPAADRPPTAGAVPGPFDGDGTFVFDALNVYFNGPVDVPISSAPPVGSAATLRVFLDHQRASLGSFPDEDWPILLKELPVAADGSVRDPAAPANVPLFEQLRSADGRVPRLGPAARPTGAAHVAGLNYGRPGAVVRCVGCHAGHTMLPVPASREAARWSNLAPGAEVTASSTHAGASAAALIDRRARSGSPRDQWRSEDGELQGQWVRLAFPVPIRVRTVRVHRALDDRAVNAATDVRAVTVRLFADAAGTDLVGSCRGGPVHAGGTDIACRNVVARSLRVDLDAVRPPSPAASVSLGEVEVIAAPAAPRPATTAGR